MRRITEEDFKAHLGNDEYCLSGLRNRSLQIQRRRHGVLGSRRSSIIHRGHRLLKRRGVQLPLQLSLYESKRQNNSQSTIGQKVCKQ